MKEDRSVVMALSGGMDSATMLAYFLTTGYKVECVHIQYGSKHNFYEKEAAEKIASHYGVSLRHYDISDITSSFTSALLKQGGDIPEGSYTSVTMKQTVVPARNLIFASIMAGLAWSLEYKFIAMGVHLSDKAIYPDCREEFVKSLDLTIHLATEGRVHVITPFVSLTKSDICGLGLKLKVPYELTRTCYKEQPISCGRCGACIERLEAFYKNGIKDPLEYEDKEYWKKVIGVEGVDI